MLTGPEIVAGMWWDAGIQSGESGWHKARTTADDAQIGIDP